MRRMLAVAKKEVLHMRRDVRLVVGVLLMPILNLLLFSYALSTDVTNVSTAIIDQDNTQVSRQMTSAFEHSEFFAVTQHLTSSARVDDVFDRGEDKAIVIVRRGFANEIAAGRKGHVAVLLDGTDPNAAQRAQGYANGLTQAFGGKIAVDYARSRGVNPGALGGMDTRAITWYNPEGRDQYFLIPGLIMLLTMGVAMQQTALAIVKERELGTAEQLMVSPLRRLELMLGKVLPWAVLSLLDVVAISLFGILVFHVPFRGSVALFAVASLLFVMSSLGLGLWLSSISPTVAVATQAVSILSILPAFMLSGFVFSIANMPPALQAATFLFPARYYTTINRTLFLKGSGFEVLWAQFAALAVYAIVAIALATITFKKQA